MLVQTSFWIFREAIWDDGSFWIPIEYGAIGEIVVLPEGLLKMGLLFKVFALPYWIELDEWCNN